MLLHAKRTEIELTDLKNSFDHYVSSITEKNFDQTLDFTLPPSMYKALNELGEEKSFEEIKAISKAILVDASRHFEISNVTVDFDNMKSGNFDNGEPYFLIPSTTTIVSKDKTLKLKKYYLAVMENKNWYFLSPQSQTQKSLLETFPGIEKIKAIPQSIETMD